MLEDESRDVEKRQKHWDERAERYDEWYRTFKGAVEQWVDWELLKGYLPQNRDSRILDAAGGTGRITLPLAKLGYSVTLCDISPGMLNVARQKIIRERVSDRVKILKCDIRNLPFLDGSFDFVLCWNGVIEAAKELIRVAKKGGKISIFLVNRCRGAIDLIQENLRSALALIRSHSDHIYDHGERYRAVSPEEAKELIEAEGIEVIDIYGVCGWLDLFPIPKKVLESTDWDEKLFSQINEMVLRLSKESAVKGMSRHLVLYGKKI